jgi:hypothetical protein
MNFRIGFHRGGMVDYMIKTYANATPEMREAGRNQLHTVLLMARYPKKHPLASGKGVFSSPMAPEHVDRFASEIIDAVCAGDQTRATELFAEVNRGKIEPPSGP